jgi:hypothetical protein
VDALNKFLCISIEAFPPQICRIAALPHCRFVVLLIYVFEVTCVRCLELTLFRLSLCSKGLRFFRASAFLDALIIEQLLGVVEA